MKVTPALIFLLLTAPAFAKVRLETTLEPRVATVGDVLTLQVNAVTDASAALPHQVPRALRTDAPGDCRMDVGRTAGPFEVLSISSAPAPGNGRTFRLALALYDVGGSTLPALTVHCGERGLSTDVKTPEIPVTIKSVLTPQSKDIHGLKGRLRKVLNVPALVALLIILLAVGVGVWVFRYRPGIAGLRPVGPPPVPPHVRALEELRRLEGDLALPAKAFYSRLTDILRAYLEGAFRWPATDRTTAEIAAELKTLPITMDQRMGLRTVLEDGDLAKFAKLEPTAEERLTDFERVRDFVVATRPAEKKEEAK